MKNSIYKTVDDVAVIQAVEEITAFIRSKPELTWAALIDTAFDYGQDAVTPDFGTLIDCYSYPELQGLSTVAPRLVTLFCGSRLRAQITRLIRHCQGRPMLSFIGTTESLEDVSARWRAVHMVSVVDEQQMLLRFADTRILSYLPHVLTSSQWAAICGEVSIWIYFDRSGVLTASDIPSSSNFTEKISITKEQFAELLDASHPDAVMCLIEESMYDIVPKCRPVSERYRMVKESYEIAKENKVNDNADILALAVAAYISDGASNVDKRLVSLLRQRSWTTGSLGNAIVHAQII